VSDKKSAGAVSLKDGQYLFRENEPSDALYVIKSGKILITKAKGNSEIVLAEIGPGGMLGEMAFFDNRSRSASAKAKGNTEVIALPFVSLYAQFKTFPEWLKAMVKTINNHLREANQKIKNLETASKDEAYVFDSYSLNTYIGLLSLVATKYGQQVEGGVEIPYNLLRDFTIQVFQLATNKMFKLLDQLTELEHCVVENIGDGQKRLVLKSYETISDLSIYYNRWLYKAKDKRIEFTARDLPPLKALIFYGEKAQKLSNEDKVKISLTDVQNDSMRDLGYLTPIEMFDALIEKGLISDKVMENNMIYTTFDLKSLKTQTLYWEIIFTLLALR
jgi:CRP-like cAMP-binding protein